MTIGLRVMISELYFGLTVKEKNKMTMGDHIRNMTDIELGKFIADIFFAVPNSDDKEEFQRIISDALGEEEDS